MPIEDDVNFKLRADIPHTGYNPLTLTIHQNSMILLREIGEDEEWGKGIGITFALDYRE
ncbi:MAG: hypothetical protein GWO20_15825 [Candidatus Korarchaeota archaeon]|nr:hypothetical protein [Candidatus Korarchaeota archaeon]NIU84940.1 hypothetical protein [Candidatus Thorarchaeota archaeon]NIW14957.1 hypothetical protein [Candidatus Thorarchaeota archaeon]NIW52924.1 hypothetical protein [Candidatus Korarchaeota archaeon]